MGKIIKEQKAMLWRRLPLLALSSIMYFLYDVFGTFMILQIQRSQFFMDDDFAARGAYGISAFMGMRGFNWFIGSVGAIILAIQGFAYLYKSQTVDFYESRPEKRSTRFANITVNGFFIYFLPSFICMILSMLIAAANGCLLPWLIADMLLGYCLQTIIFLAVYGMSILASLLTGTVVTAVLMNLFIFAFEFICRFTLLGYRAAYYATFDSDKSDGILSNIYTVPAYNYIKGIMDSNLGNLLDNGGSHTVADILSCAGAYAKGTLINLLLFVISIVIAYLVYKNRKAEAAGKAVIYRPLEVFIKITTGVLFSLEAGLFIYWIFNESRAANLGPIIITILLTVFITSLILESIFAQNVRMAFHRAWHMPVTAVISIAILFIFRTGVTGYDRYLPAESSVESSWLLNYNYNTDSYDDYDNYIPTTAYMEKNMFLNCTADMLKLAEISQAKAVEIRKNSIEEWNSGCFYAIIGWRLKDGRIVTRKVMIPESIDPALMDRIVGTEEFVKGVYHIDDVVPFMEKSRNADPKRTFTISTTTEHGSIETKKDVAEAFLDVYRKDLQEHYNYTLASEHNPEGYVNLYDNKAYNVTWPIYENYDNSIAFLESEELWSGGFLTPSEVDKVVVQFNKHDEETDEFISDTQEFTEAGKIEELMDASISNVSYSAWMKNSILDNDAHSVEIYPKEGTQADGNNTMTYFRNFYKGKIPSYITQ
ncbi:MAG: hypothetical protein K5668_09470 [Lachnospiraceae bacterium]|nr:hypothetical protein [Lachnospiraceae bacterium]